MPDTGKDRHFMDLKGSQKFNANPQAVWDALHNAALLKSVMPGASELEWQGDSAIAIAGTLELGPMKQSIRGTISVPESNPPSHMKLSVTRTGITAEANIDLVPDGTGTMLNYDAHANLSGAFAAAEMAKPIVQSQMNGFFSRLNEKLG
jgi:carbon monoxide dehydrogenase subunit G